MITILGPTASGKTSLAAALAAKIDAMDASSWGGTTVGAEIISADSRQVYRGMDIGTGKDLADYTVTDKVIPYHLIDICEPGTKYNLFQYQQDFYDAYQDIQRRHVLPILCGGTGLYIESVLKGYHLSPVPQNPELRKQLEGKSLEELTVMLKDLKAKTGSNMHNRTDVDTAQRAIRAIEIESYNLEHPMPERELPAVDSLIIGVNIDRDARREKITRRLHQRLEEGMVDEIKGLLDSGIPAVNIGQRNSCRKPHLLWLRIQVYHRIRHWQDNLRGDGERFGNRHPSVCQTSDDLVPRYGTPRFHHPLGRCSSTDGAEGGASTHVDE
ncbi:tRNA dimethylallyltransferase 1 [Prevotella sp. CAG:732]|nr:tRNA dimethylallyltransferase 1 [Prevotella sp. CAG:732]